MALLSLSPTAGTQSDIVARLKSVLPNGWFPDSTPVLDGLLNGLASAWTNLVSLLGYTQLQTRIATATDIFLDLVAQDFFAGGMVRGASEPDSSLRARIQASLLAPRATRNALTTKLVELTSRPADIFEPARLQDTGAYTIASALAYNTAGGYGSFALPFQCFVHAYRPFGAGVSNTNGYGGGASGYGVGQAQYTTPAMAASTIRDSDITAAIAAIMPVATTAWVIVTN
jgi:hypothetical protein